MTVPSLRCTKASCVPRSRFKVRVVIRGDCDHSFVMYTRQARRRFDVAVLPGEWAKVKKSVGFRRAKSKTSILNSWGLYFLSLSLSLSQPDVRGEYFCFNANRMPNSCALFSFNPARGKIRAIVLLISKYSLTLL